MTDKTICLKHHRQVDNNGNCLECNGPPVKEDNNIVPLSEKTKKPVVYLVGVEGTEILKDLGFKELLDLQMSLVKWSDVVEAVEGLKKEMKEWPYNCIEIRDVLNCIDQVFGVKK